MAGLLAWAADVVVGAGGASDDESFPAGLPVLLSTEQQARARELDRRAAELRRANEELKARIPPEHIAQRLPHLHAHSLASNAALALQLTSHSSTREQIEQRERTLQEENISYENAISDCQQKVQEKQCDADILRSKLRSLEQIEQELKGELDKATKEAEANQQASSEEGTDSKQHIIEAEFLRRAKVKDLEQRKEELRLLEERMQKLEREWVMVQEESARRPSPAQREKQLEKQLHNLIEQLTAKQAQAEILASEIRSKEKELERLNSLRQNLDSGTAEVNSSTRNRFGRSFPVPGISNGYSSKYYRPNQQITRTENQNQQKLMILRSGFVIYILILHVIVFIKLAL